MPRCDRPVMQRVGPVSSTQMPAVEGAIRICDIAHRIDIRVLSAQHLIDKRSRCRSSNLPAPRARCSASREHTDLVCEVNLCLLEGVLAGLDATQLQARLKPEPGHCCVRRLEPNPTFGS